MEECQKKFETFSRTVCFFFFATYCSSMNFTETMAWHFVTKYKFHVTYTLSGSREYPRGSMERKKWWRLQSELRPIMIGTGNGLSGCSEPLHSSESIRRAPSITIKYIWKCKRKLCRNKIGAQQRAKRTVRLGPSAWIFISSKFSISRANTLVVTLLVLL